MTVAVASQKGGTGKTTTAISVTAGLSLLFQKKVLLIDLDSQANSSKVLLKHYAEIPKEETTFTTILEEKPLPIHSSEVEGLEIVPSHILLSDTDLHLAGQMFGGHLRLKRYLDKIRDQYDYIFIDCPPALSWLTINAFTAADNVLIPLSPGYFELDSVMQINRAMDKVRDHFNPTLSLLGYLFTMSDSTRNAAVSLEMLRSTFADKVLNTVIPRNTTIRDAHFQHQSIFSYDEGSKSAGAYKALIKEVFGHG